MNRKKTERIYREEKLTARRRRGRQKATGSRAPILVEAVPNARWSVDFVHGQLVTGRRLRILNVVTKECLAAVVDTPISGKRVARELNAHVAWRGKPNLVVSDHGTGFTSNAMLEWTQETGLAWQFIAPGKPAVGRWVADYNQHRVHTALDTPHLRPTPPNSPQSATRPA